jgi:hypothetical protein
MQNRSDDPKTIVVDNGSILSRMTVERRIRCEHQFAVS